MKIFEVCESAFTHNNSLRFLKEYMQEIVIRYRCDECESALSRCQVHMRIHKGERPYNCVLYNVKHSLFIRVQSYSETTVPYSIHSQNFIFFERVLLGFDWEDFEADTEYLST